MARPSSAERHEGREDRGTDLRRPLTRALGGRSMQDMARSEGIATILVEGAEDFAIFGMDHAGTILSWNIGAQRLTGYTPGDAVGKDFSILWPPQDVAAGKDRKELQDAAHGAVHEENWIVRKDGSRFWAGCTVRRILGEDGRSVGFVKVMRELTRQKAAEEEARLAQVRLKRFMAQVVHEMRNPLSPIEMRLGLLQRSTLDAGQRRSVETIQRNLARVRRLCDDLADTAQAEAGTFSVEKAPVDLASLVGEAMDLRAEAAGKAGIVIATEVPAGLRVLADRRRIVQVLDNLVANGLRYAGGRLAVSAGREGSMARVCVEDAGPGLDEGEIGRLFQAFGQVDEQARSGGLGLGLYLSKAIVEGHGGRIWADSDGKGKGSRFCFTLPLAD